MASFPVCDGTLDFTSGYPSCTGTWIPALYQGPFDVSQIDPVSVVEAFGAGLIFMGVPMLVSLLGRSVISSILGKKS